MSCETPSFGSCEDVCAFRDSRHRRHSLLLGTWPTTLPAFAAIAMILPGVTPMLAGDLARRASERQILGDLLHALVSVANQAADIHLCGDLIRYRGPFVFDQQVQPIAVQLLDLDSIADLCVPRSAAPCRSCGRRRDDPV